VNGDTIRNVKFSRGLYDASQVNDLLERIATELDAGRPTGPVIANATFQKERIFRPGCDTGAVDWFLDHLRRREDPSEEARRNTDPWRDLDADPYHIRSEPGDLARHVERPSQQEYADAWRDFGQQPGIRLSWVRTGGMRRELRTADQQTVASFRYGTAFPVGQASFRGYHTLSIGGRTFTLKRVTRSAWPGIAETISRDRPGEPAHSLQRQANDRDSFLRQLLPETGIPILYTGGRHFDRHAGAYIKFPDQRWLRFPVRGTKRANAIMTAVDQAGNKIARYRFAASWMITMEIAIHPDHRLTEELALAIAVSAPWVGDYFRREGGGG
jgi:DivIVA domain-containing protein